MDVDRDEFRAVKQNTDASALNIVRLQEQVAGLQKAVTELVTKAEFTPVKMIAYGLATAVMTSVIMAILAKVIMK